MVVNDYLDFIHDVIVHESFGNVWLIGFITLTVIILIVQAIVTSTRGTGFEGIYIFLGILVSTLWPFLLMFIIIPLAPFFGAYWLTQWIAKEIYSTKKEARDIMKSNMNKNDNN